MNDLSCKSRRTFFSNSAKIGLSFVFVGGSSEVAEAKDDLFKKNPLTNPVLEKIRILEQAEADNVQYNGELEMGDAGNRGKVSQYPALLVPILKIASELSEINTLVQDPENWKKAKNILSQEKYEKIQFKKIFNKFGDNIYYSDPDRANVYLGGGASPNSNQSLAYMLRNDILTNMESLGAELDYLLKDTTSADEKAQTEDLLSYAKSCDDAMKRYLELVPPNEIKIAEDLMTAKK